MMAFGAGTLISAVGYELIPEANLAPRLADRRGVPRRRARLLRRRPAGRPRRRAPARRSSSARCSTGSPSRSSSGSAWRSAARSASPSSRPSCSPTSPRAWPAPPTCATSGISERRITLMWGSLTVVCGIASMAGYLVADTGSHTGEIASAFAGGAVLTMLADSMVPESYERAGRRRRAVHGARLPRRRHPQRRPVGASVVEVRAKRASTAPGTVVEVRAKRASKPPLLTSAAGRLWLLADRQLRGYGGRWLRPPPAFRPPGFGG